MLGTIERRVETASDSAGEERKLLAPRPGYADPAGSQRLDLHNAQRTNKSSIA
jgi:hypothetical protein